MKGKERGPYRKTLQYVELYRQLLEDPAYESPGALRFAFCSVTGVSPATFYRVQQKAV